MNFDPDLILVVDDNEINRVLGRAHLELLGWRVEEAAGGQAALDFMATHAPAGVMLDIRMPGVDGMAVARALAEHPFRSRMRLVAYTAHAIPEEVTLIRSMGFDHVLIKPVTLAQTAEAFPDRNAAGDLSRPHTTW